MFRKQFLGIILLFALIADGAHAGLFDTDPISELYAKSGLAFQVTQFPTKLRDEIKASFKFDQRIADTDPLHIEFVLNSIKKAYNIKIIRTGVKKTLETHLTTDDLNKSLAWLNSATGQKITALEEKASFLDLKMEMVVFKQEQQLSPASTNRQALISELYYATKIVESAVIINMITEMTIKLSVLETQKSMSQSKIYRLLKIIMDDKKNIENQLKPHIISNLMLTFQSASDRELSEYIEFARSTIGIKYHRALLDAFNSTLIDASLNFGERILTSQHKLGH